MQDERKPAILALADGQVFQGWSVGASGNSVGELVFNTAMTGYQEMLTDPSYTGQLITLTTAHVGNTGCNDEDMESSQVHAAGLVMRDCAMTASNYRAEYSFPAWLKNHAVVAIAGVDTRALTLLLRTQGAIGACISTDVSKPELAIQKAKDFPGFDGVDLAHQVSRTTVQAWTEGHGEWAHPTEAKGNPHIVVIDYGVKHSILRILIDRGCRVTIVPARTSAEDVLALKPDGVLLSNGPGDPKVCDYAIQVTQMLLEKQIPVLGICLGFQILALACGAQSLKMKFGHHGANHPVMDIRPGVNRVMITSQNHGYAIDEASLPDFLEVTHRSLFDNSLQGIRHREKPVLGFQGHPEASPGPHDIEIIFDEFLQILAYDSSF